MNYKNAEHVLPQDLLERIQEYTDGELIYIPRKLSNKKNWGQNTETRIYLHDRNREILHKYELGNKVREIAEQYFLSEKTIYKIIAYEKR